MLGTYIYEKVKFFTVLVSNAFGEKFVPFVIW